LRARNDAQALCRNGDPEVREEIAKILFAACLKLGLPDEGEVLVSSDRLLKSRNAFSRMLIAEAARPFFNRARNAECLVLALS
jgi:hypothetical protein